MVKKKGKKKKKTAVDTAITGNEDGGNELNLDGEGAQLGIGKKKKPKKKKLTKEEKEAAKLAKKLLAFQEDEAVYTNFWHKMNKWMIQNSDSVISVFKHFDVDDKGTVPYSVFKAGLRDISCPVLDIEMYALSRILDPENTGEIEYTNFKAGMRQPLPASDSEEENNSYPEDYKPSIITSKDKIPFQTFGDPYQAKFPRYVGLDMKLKDFISLSNHPGHFSIVVVSQMTVRGLINKICEHTEINSGQLRIYTSKECKQEECLHPRLTLEDCGFQGGMHHAPERGTLYYDYFVEYDDCPLLNCDYYFGNYTKPHNPVLKAFPDYEERMKKKVRAKNTDDNDL